MYNYTLHGRVNTCLTCLRRRPLCHVMSTYAWLVIGASYRAVCVYVDSLRSQHAVRLWQAHRPHNVTPAREQELGQTNLAKFARFKCHIF